MVNGMTFLVILLWFVYNELPQSSCCKWKVRAFYFHFFLLTLLILKLKNLKPETIEIEVKSERIALYISDGKE